MADNIVSQISYEIKDVIVENDNSATVSLSIIAPDMVTIFYDEANKSSSTNLEDISDVLLNIFKSDFPIIEYNILMEAKYVDGNWHGIVSEDFANVLTGGLFKYYQQQEQRAFDEIIEKAE